MQAAPGGCTVQANVSSNRSNHLAKHSHICSTIEYASPTQYDRSAALRAPLEHRSRPAGPGPGWPRRGQP